MRLDNLVSKALSISRNDARKLIVKSKVLVNQKIERLKNRQIGIDDQVFFASQRLTLPANKYFMLNKPPGYICSTVDESTPSAINLLEDQPRNGLHFAGRLDADTTGLVLISNDGQWTHRISAPSRKQAKTYIVELAEVISPEQVIQLENGLILNDSEKKTLPCSVEVINDHAVKMTLFEGRYHQVKRMFAAVGNHVKRLHRESIGELILDAELPIGGWRNLTEQEVSLFEG